MNAPLKIAVLVSPAGHPLSGQPVRSTSDAAAFELACTLARPEQITVLCAGMVSREAMSEYLGLGAPAVEVLTVSDDADVVPALVARLHRFDIVLCGARSQGQFSSGLLPYLLAEGLQVPLIGDVLEVQLNNRSLSVLQLLPKGVRRRLEATLPVTLAVHARAPQTRQYAYARAVAGRVTYMTAAHASARMRGPHWQFEDGHRRPRPLKAKVAQSGHSRMLSAIGGDTGAQSGEVIKQGSAEQKAQTLLAYLREHRLVNF
jgi:electron transfer flavoprotein beta subunit